MANLFIIAASMRHSGAALVPHLTGFADSLPDAVHSVLLHPAGLPVAASAHATPIAYDGAIGLEVNAELWRPLAGSLFTHIVIFGTSLAADAEEIVLAGFLNGLQRSHISGTGSRDLAPWQAQMRPSLAPRAVQMRPLEATAQRDYVRRVHRWLATELIQADFEAPQRLADRHPDMLLYTKPHLAADLAQLTTDLQHEHHGMPFSVFRCFDGRIAQSADFYRAIANFVGAVDGIDSVLDVGCGSGFLACHLAASGRYADVLGIDASPFRVAGARLHAELQHSPARFEQSSMAEIALPDKAVDLSVTSFALEQSGDHLERCFAEIRRVTRKLVILVEPSNEFFGTLPSLWHVPRWGWANQYHAMLVRSGLAYAMRPSLLSHYYNPGTVFVIDLESATHPALRYPQLFGLGVEDWPGGVTLV